VPQNTERKKYEGRGKKRCGAARTDETRKLYEVQLNPSASNEFSIFPYFLEKKKYGHKK
jgi:hypothetical protein